MIYRSICYSSFCSFNFFLDSFLSTQTKPEIFYWATNTSPKAPLPILSMILKSLNWNDFKGCYKRIVSFFFLISLKKSKLLFFLPYLLTTFISGSFYSFSIVLNCWNSGKLLCLSSKEIFGRAYSLFVNRRFTSSSVSLSFCCSGSENSFKDFKADSSYYNFSWAYFGSLQLSYFLNFRFLGTKKLETKWFSLTLSICLSVLDCLHIFS